MRYAVVAYPKLEEADRLWIETIRARHDPQAALIPAHFTLMFPAPVDLEVVKAAAGRAAAACASFDVRLDRAVAHRDGPESRSHVFLLPGTGENELRRLHETVYDGVLNRWLDPRIPFRPHVTIAGGLSEHEASSIALNLNQHPVGMAGSIDGLTIVSIDGGVLSPVAAVPLERIAF